MCAHDFPIHCNRSSLCVNENIAKQEGIGGLESFKVARWQQTRPLMVFVGSTNKLTEVFVFHRPGSAHTNFRASGTLAIAHQPALQAN